MMKTLSLTLFLFSFGLLSPALSQTPSPLNVAEKVALEFSKLKVPGKSENSFEHWTYNTALFSTTHCWMTLIKGVQLPKVLVNSKVTTPGTWSQPSTKDNLKTCQSLADKGIKPVCTYSTLWIKNVKRQTDLPLNYLQVYKNKPIEVEGTLSCSLNSDQLNMQTYAGPLLGVWSEMPNMKSIQFPNGPRNLEAGTIMVTAPHAVNLMGKTYTEPRMTIVIAE